MQARFVSVIGLEQVVESLLYNNARRATKFLSEKEVIRAVRPCYRGKLPRKGSNLKSCSRMADPITRSGSSFRPARKLVSLFPERKSNSRFRDKDDAAPQISQQKS